ncbi:MAG: hypothetical protein ACRCZO_10240, partial [Cetobacterium sp.]
MLHFEPWVYHSFRFKVPLQDRTGHGDFFRSSAPANAQKLADEVDALGNMLHLSAMILGLV